MIRSCNVDYIIILYLYAKQRKEAISSHTKFYSKKITIFYSGNIDLLSRDIPMQLRPLST